MNEELDSQLSAMFDDELASAECELLARRLSRDEQLKARWGRYAVIGAAIRSERGIRLNAALAGRVSEVLSAEPAFATASAVAGMRRARLRWWQPLAGGALAAGVAAASIMWLRAAGPLGGTVAQLTPAAGSRAPLIAASPVDGGAASASYVVPPPPPQRATLVPNTELANYVMAHSVFSAPVAQRNLLSAFMSSESANAPAEEPQEDAQNVR